MLGQMTQMQKVFGFRVSGRQLKEPTKSMDDQLRTVLHQHPLFVLRGGANLSDAEEIVLQTSAGLVSYLRLRC